MKKIDPANFFFKVNMTDHLPLNSDLRIGTHIHRNKDRNVSEKTKAKM